MPDVALYEACRAEDRHFQGEVLSNVLDRQAHITSAPSAAEEVFEIQSVVHPFVVIVSQDCDLEQHHRASKETDPTKRSNVLDHVLLLAAEPWDEAKTRIGNSRARERVPINKEERYQFLAGVPPVNDACAEGVPELLLDFKRVFSIPAQVLASQIVRGSAKRRARLVTPYAEHLSVRFGFFYQRIGLTVDHHDANRAAAV